MKNQVISFLSSTLCCCLCLISITQNLSAQNCRPVSSFSGASNGTHMDLQWTGVTSQGGVRYEIKYYTNLGTSFFTTSNTNLKVRQTPGAQYELYGIVPHYNNGCKGVEAFWSSDIIIMIDDVYKKITDSCQSEEFLNRNMLINAGGSVFAISGFRLCCLIDHIQTQTNAYAIQEAMFTGELYYYLQNGGVFSEGICEEDPSNNDPQYVREGNSTINSEYLIVSPNPANHYTNITIPTNLDNTAEITLITMTGKVAMRIPVHHGQPTVNVRIAELPKGVYTLSLRTDERAYFGKLVKQ